ncbi:fungal-specific transcription factor domain-containing protein [Mycena rosella]|uniref:Fungal-specific transcription factor domain-containing protein n=1 Tax=Mycena rosella TaxID=1033263 RepID=A0AAD7DU19_MYCRO|nr:fungal-specific transcription factor domain-containing protein [Mycena rosella]
MSSEDNGSNVANVRNRPTHRACDICHRRKRDGLEPCGTCIQREFKCTYEQGARATGISSSYVQCLENRLETVEMLLRDATIRAEGIDAAPASTPRNGPAVEIITLGLRSLNRPFPAPHKDDVGLLGENMGSLSLNSPGSHVFQGKSSSAMFVKAAVDLKGSRPSNQPRNIKPWEFVTPRPNYDFPEDDLAIALISLYFDNINIFFSLLHRPTFESAFAATLHLRNDGFGGTLLLVCALGALYSDDPRVHPAAVPSGSPAGWRWFSQAVLVGHQLSSQPTLYDLQSYCLTTQFLERTSSPRASWTLVGIGMRLAQDIGAHREKLRTRMITPEEELEKRAYWVMFLFDTQLSAALGRSIAIQMHDVNLASPVRCDDQYWAASLCNAEFCQPPNTPSVVDFFASFLKLNDILHFALKFLYSTNRMSTTLATDDELWQEKLVMEFDSALNKWFDSVPAHLRWDPACPSDMFLDQSAALHCSYYFMRILVHRPFIPAIQSSDTPSPYPSLSICNTAARACIHVAEIQHRRRPNNPLVFGQTAVFTAGIVLLLNMWGSNRTGRVPDTDLLAVHRCIDVLRAHKIRWPSTGPLLYRLV